MSIDLSCCDGSYFAIKCEECLFKSRKVTRCYKPVANLPPSSAWNLTRVPDLVHIKKHIEAFREEMGHLVSQVKGNRGRRNDRGIIKMTWASEIIF